MNTETTREMLERTCTLDTYEKEQEGIHERAHATPTHYGYAYSWQSLVAHLEAYKELLNDPEVTLYQRMHVKARWLAVGDWMNRVHDTADGHIAVMHAVPVPHDYPFS